jgi:hypothetical protein
MRKLWYTPVSSQEYPSAESLCCTHYVWQRFTGIDGGIVISAVFLGTLFFFQTVYLPASG